MKGWREEYTTEPISTQHASHKSYSLCGFLRFRSGRRRLFDWSLRKWIHLRSCCRHERNNFRIARKWLYGGRWSFWQRRNRQTGLSTMSCLYCAIWWNYNRFVALHIGSLHLWWWLVTFQRRWRRRSGWRHERMPTSTLYHEWAE